MRYHMVALDHGVTLHRNPKREGQTFYGSALREDRRRQAAVFTFCGKEWRKAKWWTSQHELIAELIQQGVGFVCVVRDGRRDDCDAAGQGLLYGAFHDGPDIGQ